MNRKRTLAQRHRAVHCGHFAKGAETDRKCQGLIDIISKKKRGWESKYLFQLSESVARWRVFTRFKSDYGAGNHPE
jgi:hypothetical protein